jgi:hypothetical protein
MKLRALATVTLIAMAPATSWADDSAGTALLRRGIALRREQRNEEALAEFQAANKLEPSVCAVAQMGLARQALGRWVDAESDLVSALSHADDTWVQKHRAALEEALASVTSELGWLDVATDAPGAVVVIADRTVPASHGPIRVPVGEIAFEVRAPGYVPAARAAEIHPRTHSQVDLRLTPEQPPAAAPPPKASAAPAPPPVAQQEDSRVPGVATRDERPASGTPASTESTAAWGGRPYAIGLLIVGGVGMGLGAWFGLRAIDAENTVASQCTARFCDSVGLAADHDARAWSTASTVSFALGAGAAAAGGLWLILAPRSRVRVTPTIGESAGVLPARRPIGGAAGFTVEGAL